MMARCKIMFMPKYMIPHITALGIIGFMKTLEKVTIIRYYFANRFFCLRLWLS